MRSFDAVADQYDADRPSYPAAVYEILESRAGTLAGKLIADGGSGTGIVARQLLERGAEVVALDPGREMLRHAVAHTPSLRTVVADASAVPLRSYALDVACFGQSWRHGSGGCRARKGPRRRGVNTAPALPRRHADDPL
ncbi:MAG: class I SAM-dependent methyltransferase [Acidimicrobiales bacterium]